ncbi:hypothetical protein EUX98_g6622 [Antrodiella citrinella]|uniref:Borealin N-terminal domain-containing protein n=1 Tax=Antrodiella citrinella TaxID=2447956 RepID=A0A4S4MQL5_9APHY|nr:hypothetical protein EUX98_g6622 [Antrodiella citrinella]
MSIRIGQICGATATGAWSSSDWVPIIVKSSVAIGALPIWEEEVSWIPMDVTSACIVDALFSCSEKTPPEVINIVHPQPVFGQALFEGIKDALRREGLKFVSYKDWIARIEELAATSKTEQDLQRIPALKTMGFLRALNTASGTLTFDTTNAQGLSQTLKDARALGREDAAKKYTVEEKTQLLANLDLEVAHRTRQFESWLADALENFRIHQEGLISRVPRLVRDITMRDFAKYNGDVQECLKGIQRERLGGGDAATIDMTTRKRKWVESQETEKATEEAELSKAPKTPRITMATPKKKAVPFPAPGTAGRSRLPITKTPSTVCPPLYAILLNTHSIICSDTCCYNYAAAYDLPKPAQTTLKQRLSISETGTWLTSCFSLKADVSTQSSTITIPCTLVILIQSCNLIRITSTLASKRRKHA